MKKNKYFIVVSLFILALVLLAGNVQARKGEDDNQPVNSAAAQAPGLKLRGNGSVDDTQPNALLSTSTGTSTATSTATTTPTTTPPVQNRNRASINALEHRSAVANFVQGLLKVADREPGGIGGQVREVARAQSSSTETVVQAMEKVQTRSKIKTFLFGSDYKNLGKLRSEMVQTRNRLEQLNRLLSEVTNEADKTELQNQISTLEQEQEKIQTFIAQKEQEGKYSLFGWLMKLFN